MNREPSSLSQTALPSAQPRVDVAGGSIDADDVDPPEVALGHRLFKETRFAQYFAAHSSDVNQPLAQGDPVLEFSRSPRGNAPGPYRGQVNELRYLSSR